MTLNGVMAVILHYFTEFGSCDGSRIESYSQSGAGIFNYTDSEEFFIPLGKLRSVFQAEL